tara:strand:+ start:688 stop:879 length:192 start_codon:yes stop_codon:yes gene_type:complete
MYYDMKFNGYEYPVVRGSKREKMIKKAQLANRHGLFEQAIAYHIEAIQSPGCALMHKAGVRHG